jgi:DNA polymerase-1
VSAILQTLDLGMSEAWRSGWPIAFDFETFLIRPGLQLPPGVCMSWAEIVPNAAAQTGMAVGRSGVVTAADGVELLQFWLEGGARLVGANAAFDELVSIVSASADTDGKTPSAYMRLLRAWVAALETGRVHDVFVRQKLLDLAAGCCRHERRDDGKPVYHRYSLQGIAKRLCGRELSKNDGEDDTDHWRLRFGELAGLPVAQYPKEAYDYALEDAVATAEVFIAQELSRHTDKRIQHNFPGRDPFVDEARQTIACVPLRAMAAYGLRTDAAAVERLAAEVEAKIVEIRAELVEAGLVRPPAYHRNTEAIVKYIRDRGLLSHFQDAPEGQIKLCKANYETAWRATEDVSMWRLANYLQIAKSPGSFATDLQGLIAAGLVDVDHSRDTKAAAKRCADAYIALGLSVPRTDAWKDRVNAAKKDGTAPPDVYECVALDADACTGSEDPILALYSQYTSLAKTLANDIPMLRAGAYMPVHTRFEELLETGRTSSSSPNVQNVRRLPGIRECFVPRPGNVFVDCDFSMLELHTLAQVCFWVLGFSTLGEALNAGRDPHLQMAAKIIGADYETAKARREAGDSEVDNARTAGKGVNFGRPGGLGVKTFVVYAWTNYRIRLTKERVAELLDMYDDTWIEMPSYFGFIDGLKDPATVKIVIDPETKKEKRVYRYNVVQPWSGRLRAHASYCAACNSPFQGLGSDVAKMALWLVWKATMGLSELGEADPLFGCHMVNFVHDSIMTEAPEVRAHAAALRQKELMEIAGRVVLPSVPVKADMLVTRQWSKKAQQWRAPCGACGSPTKCKCEGVAAWKDRPLIPWDLRAAARRALDAWAAEHAGEGRDAALAYLKKTEWPTDVARDTAAEFFERAAA